MISKKKLEELGFQNYQIEEIRLAEKNGVDEDLIHKWLENTEFDSYQMFQIRKGLQDGLDVSLYANKDIPYTEMERIRLQQLVEKNKKDEQEAKKIKEEKKAERKEKRNGRLEGIKSFFTTLLIILLIATLGTVIYLFKDSILKSLELLELELPKEVVELSYGDKFNADDYVIKVTEGDEIIKIWPQFTTDELGEFKLEYVITNNVKAVKKYLKVKVIDDEAPVIKLSDEKISLTRNVDDFNGFIYIESVTDNYDSSPKVEISMIDWSKNSQDVEYKATDSEGNISTAYLHIDIRNKPQTSSTPSVSSNTTDSSGSDVFSSGNNGGGNSSSGSTWSESWTVDYTDYQPSNGQTDVTYTNNDTGESYTVSDSDVGPYESDEDLWSEIDNLGN